MPQPSISETEIVNSAMGEIGASPIQDIGNLGDPRTAAAARLYYRQRDALLRSCRWNFARTFATLAQLAGAPPGLALAPDPDYAGSIVYTGAYQLPSDYLRLSNVSPYRSHWRIVGQAIYTDAAPPPVAAGMLIGMQPPNADGADNVPGATPVGGSGPGIEYIRRVTDATQFDPLFVDCLILRIAYRLAFTVNAMESLRNQIRQDAEAALNEARVVDGMEAWPEQLFDNVLIDVRHGYGGSGAGADW